MNKSYRHGQILKLIQRKRIHTQEELSKALSEIGVEATQVTLSRDIKELGLVKTADGYSAISVGAGPKPRDVAAVVAEFLLDMRVAQNLIVLRTLPGNANALAVALDREDWPEITGTIAGDDTVLVVAPDSKVAAKLRARIAKMVR